MSLEQNLATATQALTETNQTVGAFYGQQVAAVDARLAGVDSALGDLPMALQNTVYLDTVNGDDADNGRQDAPFRSLDRAMESIPRNGRATIWLLSDVVINAAYTAPGLDSLYIRGHADLGRKARVTLNTVERASGNFTHRASFLQVDEGSAVLAFRGCVLDMPALNTNAAHNVEKRGLISAGTAGGPITLALHDCEIDMPFNQETAMMDPGPRSSFLSVVATTYDANRMAGFWIDGVPAGSSPASLDDVSSNIGSL